MSVSMDIYGMLSFMFGVVPEQSLVGSFLVNGDVFLFLAALAPLLNED